MTDEEQRNYLNTLNAMVEGLDGHIGEHHKDDGDRRKLVAARSQLKAALVNIRDCWTDE